MTTQESFKRRVRQRMAKTGERYAAARRTLIEQAEARAAREATPRRRVWVSEPEVGNDAVVEGTGRSWDDWVDLIEAWPDRPEGHADGHPAIAAHLEAAHHLDGWWAQTVTVGFERITGLRLPYQRRDGTFTAGKSHTVDVDHDALRPRPPRRRRPAPALSPVSTPSCGRSRAPRPSASPSAPAWP